MDEILTSALIVVGPGPLRDGLRALVSAMPQIGSTCEADDLRSALAVTSGHDPTLVLLDSAFRAEDVWKAIRRTRTLWPRARCVFLADSIEQYRQAEDAGADAVLLKGSPAAQLTATLVRLLPNEVAARW